MKSNTILWAAVLLLSCALSAVVGLAYGLSVSLQKRTEPRPSALHVRAKVRGAAPERTGQILFAEDTGAIRHVQGPTDESISIERSSLFSATPTETHTVGWMHAIEGCEGHSGSHFGTSEPCRRDQR